MADALRETIAAFNDLDCGLTIALGAARQMNLLNSDLAEIRQYVKACHQWKENAVLARKWNGHAATPGAPPPPACLRSHFAARKVPAHV